MTKEEKYEEFELMNNSDKGTIKVQIPNGPLFVSRDSWDFRTNLTETSLKTFYKPTVEHELLAVKEIHLKPAFGKPIYLVTVMRQPKSNLKDDRQKNTGRARMPK